MVGTGSRKFEKQGPAYISTPAVFLLDTKFRIVSFLMTSSLEAVRLVIKAGNEIW
jgi:hypothetical protein